MDEMFVQYLWQYQQFDHRNLKTMDGREVSILAPGTQNMDSGPDFSGSRLRIDNLMWNGNVEIHIKSSDWYNHKHNLDPAYNNVILHVVWQNKGGGVSREDGTVIPTLELQKLVQEDLLLSYDKLIGSNHTIPCSAHFENIDEVYVLSMLDRVLAGRLERKSNRVHIELDHTSHDWEESTYRVLAENFGFNKNAEPMIRLAHNLPLRILKKHANRIDQLEALLFGIAGFLHGDPIDDYHDFLQKEYHFLQTKFRLNDAGLTRANWKFSKLRPPNFPTIRLAQFARLIHNIPSLFSDLIREDNLESFLKNVHVVQSRYWIDHFDFGKKVKKPMPGLGISSLENVVINTFVPVLVAYGKSRDEQVYTDRALQYLQLLKPEYNRILKKWETVGLIPLNAFDSQAMIELNNEFCLKKKCAVCNIGSIIIGRPYK